jgi:hypothetical protein
MTSGELCAGYHTHNYASARAELVRRGEITSSEWSLIDKGNLKIGMSELALLCELGVDRINRTVTVNGTRKQYVYESNMFVYVENGVVVAYQD